MTEPSQYFKGRTVQEQMNEVIGYVDVRSAEVATDAIAADVAQVHSDAADAHADALAAAGSASAAAGSASAAAGTLANAVKKTGEASQSIDGDIDLNNDLNVDGDAAIGGALSVTGAITGDDATFTGDVTVPAPTANGHAANKKYVDDADALKADKTYVDAQDALKINITDINSYAVGLTGNQGPITGIKKFKETVIGTQALTRVATTRCVDILRTPLTANSTTLFNLLISGRFDICLARVGVTVDASSVITSVTVNAVGYFALSNTRQIKVGAYTSDGYLYLTLRAISGNNSISAMPINGNIDGTVTNNDLNVYGTGHNIADLATYVEEV